MKKITGVKGVPNEDEIFEGEEIPRGEKEPFIASEPFSQQELDEIEVASEMFPSVKKLAARYALLFSDPATEFYAGLCYASKQVTCLIMDGKLDIDNGVHKAFLAVMKDGKAYYESLRIGKEKSGNPKKEEEVKDSIKDPEPDQGGSVAERYANRNGAKKA